NQMPSTLQVRPAHKTELIATRYIEIAISPVNFCCFLDCCVDLIPVAVVPAIVMMVSPIPRVVIDIIPTPVVIPAPAAIPVVIAMISVIGFTDLNTESLRIGRHRNCHQNSSENCRKKESNIVHYLSPKFPLFMRRLTHFLRRLHIGEVPFV